MCRNICSARFFFGLAQKETYTASKFRFLIAALYSCRAIIELTLERAEKQELANFQDKDPKRNRDTLEAHIRPRIPFYDLIERIRIHDFHRFGITPPDPNRKMMFGGPMKLTAQNGSAAVRVTPNGPAVSTTGESRVKFQRALLMQDDQFFDEEEQRFVTLKELLSAFLEQVPAVVVEFDSAQT